MARSSIVRPPRARCAALLAAVVFAAVMLGAPARAGAVTGKVGAVTVSVSPTSNPADGTPVVVEAQANEGDLFEIAVHLCRHGVEISNTFDFSFAGEFCTPNPVSGNSDAETSVKIPPGSGARGSVTFRVGAGTSPPWTDLSGASHTLTCGNGSLCDIVVQLQVTGATRFFTAPLDGTTPAPPTTPPSTANPPDNPRGPTTTASGTGSPSSTAAMSPTTSAATASGAGPTVSTGPTASTDPGSTIPGDPASTGTSPGAGTAAVVRADGSDAAAGPSPSSSPAGDASGGLFVALVALVALAVGVGVGLRLRRPRADLAS